MSAPDKKFRTFEDLEVYQAAREFRMAIYKVARRLPDAEKFDLARQMRRAAVSLTNNIAEGHGRYHYLDPIRFSLIARGSVEELLDDLNVCADEGYLGVEEIPPQKQQGWRVLQLLNGYVRSLRERQAGASVMVEESSPRWDDELSADPRFNDSTN